MHQVLQPGRRRDSRVPAQHAPRDGAVAAGADGAVELPPPVQRGAAAAPVPPARPGLGAGKRASTEVLRRRQLFEMRTCLLAASTLW